MAEAGLARSGPLAAHPLVSFEVLPPTTRLSAQGGAEAQARICRAFGTEPPDGRLRARVAGHRAVLRLGPDELMLLAPEVDPAMARALEAALGGEPGCVVDVSHREVGLDVAGADVEAVLNAGCPLDLGLDAFPVGMCTRTLLGKADVVLWRRHEASFRLSCWRSFAPYVLEFLKGAASDCGF